MAKASTAPKGVKGFEQFRASHDKSYIVPLKINAALLSLGNGWEYEAEFMKRAQVSTTDFARYRDSFTDFYVEVEKKRVWAGTKAFAAKLRKTLLG